MSQPSLRHLKKIKATKFQLLSIHSKEMSLKRNLLLIHLPKAVLKEHSKILLKVLKSPSPDQASMDQYFESNNEEDISAQPGGSSIDPQSSTSKISAAAGIPESLLQGLNVSTPEEALEKLLSGDSFNTNSEGTSAPTQDEETARLEQAHLEAKFIEDFLQRDVLEVIDNDPHAFFGLKALL
jgi:hypothetical protein